MRVCEDWFPVGSRKGQKKDGFEMDDALAAQIKIAAKNIVKDWDFTILITGGGEVRVGKSVLALQIGMYWTWLMEKLHGIKVPFDVKNNIVFQWENLIETGNRLGETQKFCALQYDEAGESMQGTKTMSRELQAVKDYLRECGQYNFLNIMVLPEFFDLPKGIALTRSIFLIDVYYSSNEEGLFQRGYFKFYSRRNKKKLYLKGKRELNYNAHQFNFQGRFPNFYPIDEQKYRERKQEALRARETNKKDKMRDMRDFCWALLNLKYGLSQPEIAGLMKIGTHHNMSYTSVSEGIKPYKDMVLKLTDEDIKACRKLGRRDR